MQYAIKFISEQIQAWHDFKADRKSNAYWSYLKITMDVVLAVLRPKQSQALQNQNYKPQLYEILLLDSKTPPGEKVQFYWKLALACNLAPPVKPL